MVLAARGVDEDARAAQRVAKLPGLEQTAPLDADRLIDLPLLEELECAGALDARDAKAAPRGQPARLPRLDQDVQAALLRVPGVRERIDVALADPRDRRRAVGTRPALDRHVQRDGRHALRLRRDHLQGGVAPRKQHVRAGKDLRLTAPRPRTAGAWAILGRG